MPATVEDALSDDLNTPLAISALHQLSDPAALRAGVATGVKFHPTDAVAFGQALRQLCALHADAKTWAKVQANAMAADVGWEASAAAYAALYDGLAR